MNINGTIKTNKYIPELEIKGYLTKMVSCNLYYVKSIWQNNV